MGSREKPDMFFLSLMRSKTERIRTFHDYPASAHVSPTALVDAGFFYVGKGDDAKCAFCQEVIGDWEEGDDPMADHKKYVPNCPFVKGTDRGDDRELRSGQQVLFANDEADASKPRKTAATNHGNPAPSGGYLITAILDKTHTRMLMKKFDEKTVLAAIKQGLAEKGDKFDSERDLSSFCLDVSSEGASAASWSGAVVDLPKCKKCKSRAANTRFLPCGHTISCSICLNTPKFCQQCGAQISRVEML